MAYNWEVMFGKRGGEGMTPEEQKLRACKKAVAALKADLRAVVEGGKAAVHCSYCSYCITEWEKVLARPGVVKVMKETRQ